MLSVREKFSYLFTPRIVEVEEQDEDAAFEEAKRLSNDAKIFKGTQAYRDMRDVLQAAIDGCYADPDKGTDVAAAIALKQAGLREAQAILVRVASRHEEQHED